MHLIRYPLALCVLGLAFIAALTPLAYGARIASFQGLGFPPGVSATYSKALGVSGNGSVVVGETQIVPGVGTIAFRWNVEDGIEVVPRVPGSYYYSSATSVSETGTAIVGRMSSFDNREEAFLWTDESGVVGLGHLPFGMPISRAWDISADGSVIVGDSSSGGGVQAFLWTEGSGMIPLGDLPGGGFISEARGISPEGNVVVGECQSLYGTEACFWVPGEGGPFGLGVLSGSLLYQSIAHAASSNGMVVVGRSVSGPDCLEAFRRTPSLGMVALGDLPGGACFSRANDVSADGEVIVGISTSVQGDEAVVWEQPEGIRRLSDVLNELGVDLTGWTLTEATAISPSGNAIVGYGQHNGNTEAWLATFEAVEQCDLDVFEPDNAPQSAAPISSGETQARSICPPGDEDWANFVLANRSAAVIETSGLSGDTRMWLYSADAGLTEIATNDDISYPDNLWSRIERSCGPDALPGGSYAIKIDEFGNNNEIASYDLTFTATPCSGPDASADFDGDGSSDALTDGLLLIRHLFGFSGSALTDGAVAEDCERCTATEIASYLDQVGDAFDIDGNGATDALTDGLLLIRYLFGFTGNALIAGAVADDCTRCAATEISAYCGTLAP